MRPSGVASGLNSLKSWASKLHPQGPLTNQESTQLLNALTGAFRQKLDEAHPRNAHDDPNHPAPSHAARKAAGAVHSSAAHTDKHLASVLTSPLLGGRVLDYGTAKSELIRHPHRDPIEILEEYHQKGAASVPIAELCLSHVKQSIERLHRDRQQDSIARIKPGSRVFKWFLESQIHNVPSYVDNATFIEHLAFFLFKEGHEEHIWSWVQLDIANTDEIPRDVSDHPIKVATALNFRKYRWRARLLRGLISAKLGPIDSDGRDPGSDGMNAAFDAVFRICEMKRSQGQIDHLRWISVGPVKNLINWILSRDIHVVRRGLDVTRFERYYKLLPEMIAAPPLVAEFERARLRLVHPQGRQPANALNCLRQLFADDPTDVADKLIARIRAKSGSPSYQDWWNFVTTTIYALRQQGSTEDADWLQAHCMKEFPQLAARVETRMAEYRRHDIDYGAKLDHEQTGTQDLTGLPFPSFA